MRKIREREGDGPERKKKSLSFCVQFVGEEKISNTDVSAKLEGRVLNLVMSNNNYAFLLQFRHKPIDD